MSTHPLTIAHSPCPNDTFIFHAWSHGLLPQAPELQVTFADIHLTSKWVSERSFDLLKISSAALPLAIEAGYQLVPAGGAVGYGCGPLLLSASDKTSVADLAGASLAIPSRHSTAYRLTRKWAEQNLSSGFGEVTEVLFSDIMPAVVNGDFDAGLVIHEARFTFEHFGLHQIVDLGQWWEEQTELPIPLGAIVARDDVVAEHGIDALAQWCADSVNYAWENPDASRDYVAEHADDMDADVQRAHIALYVNQFSAGLGPEGLAAFDALLAD